MAFTLMPACSKKQKEKQTAEFIDNAEVNRVDSVDQSTGLVIDDELPLVIGNCTGCHSADLITQNRATREGWRTMISWMQQTQNLWDLGANEGKILDYLARHYAPEQTGRRQNLKNIEWYDLKIDK